MRRKLIALLCAITLVLPSVMPSYAVEAAETSATEETEVIEESEDTEEAAQTPVIELDKTKFKYNGVSQTPVVTAYDADKNLISEEYYTVTYPETSIDVGKYTLEVVFAEPYAGTVTADYEITPIAFPDADFSIPAKNYLYTGEAIEPVVNSALYEEGIDYTVAYEDNVLDGTATVTITGIGNYTDTKTLTFEIDLFSYKVLADRTICITEVSKNVTGELEIPAIYDGYTVTAITDEVFKSCKKLTAITTPETLTTIGESAFYGCTGLTSVTLNGNGLSLGDYAFYGCSHLTSVKAKRLKTIGEYAFCKCFELESIGEVGNVESIGIYAFSECKKLISVDLAVSSIKKLESHVFYGCTSLEHVELSDKVESIGDSAFKGCKSLELGELPSGLTYIESAAF